jgi:hypothetical protein
LLSLSSSASNKSLLPKKNFGCNEKKNRICILTKSRTCLSKPIIGKEHVQIYNIKNSKRVWSKLS